ncbi:transcription factor GTE10 [Artemisia annua]|uniref:Transcription factor GTE10 n=1 Tax=Artemisia annua TaxID=35608 RepID=A0A2U1QE54_ARTAN|nr:transcription factor GTE10 [Artemisia annua]
MRIKIDTNCVFSNSVNGVGQVDEQKSQSIPIPVEVDGNQDGESAPPEKLYRAALLRSRFTYDKVEKIKEKLFSGIKNTEGSLLKKLKNDMLPEIEKVQKVIDLRTC